MAKKGKSIVHLLDIGTARVAIAVARFGPGKSFEILLEDDSPSLGVRKGLIIDTHSVSRVVENLIKNVEDKMGAISSDVYLVFSGTGIAVTNFCARKSLGSPRPVVTDDTQELLNQAKENGIWEGFTTLHTLPMEYRLDGHAVPVLEGNIGQKLEVDVRLVMAGEDSIQAVHNVVRLLGKRVRKVVFSSLVEAPFLINRAELELGCVLVDLGAETTTVSAFKYGTLLDAVVLPIGMDHVVGDLAVGLRATLSSAKKLLHSWSLSGENDKAQMVKVESVGPGEFYTYEESFVSSIVDARLQEICELIKQSIHSMNLIGFIPAGIKLTGGGAMLPGIEEQFSRYLGLQVQGFFPYVSVPGADKCNLSLAGMASYCVRQETPDLRRINDGLESVFSKLQNIVFGSNQILRRRGG